VNPDPAVAAVACSVDDLPSRDTLARARWATRWQFAALGIVGGAWGVHIPSVKSQYALDEFSLSGVLLAAASGAVLSVFFAGRVINGLGARGATALAATVLCACLALVLVWPGLWLLLPMMVLFGASMSLFDVAINSEGTALEALSGRTVMSNLHGMFSVGGMAGAAFTSALLRAGVAPLAQLVAIGVVTGVLVVLATRAMLQAHPPSGEGEQAHFAWPRGLLLVIGLLIFTGMTAEGVMYDWCVLYLKQEVQMPQAQAALGYATFSAAMALARFGGDALRSRYSERSLLAAGATIAALAMAVVLLSGNSWVSLVGFALVGAGLAPVVPILFNAATRVPGVSRAAAIASVSSVGYAGFMIGPPLIGGIAHATSLTVAMAVVVLAAALLALGARRIP
jgi:fucose permease